jgi:hypothetical protein
MAWRHTLSPARASLLRGVTSTLGCAARPLCSLASPFGCATLI